MSVHLSQSLGNQPCTSDASLRELAAQKEREWRELQELRTQSLEEAVKEKEKQSERETAKFKKLKEDFKYNLRLLAERDQELERYDVVFSELKVAFQAKNAEVSDLKICLDDLHQAAQRETQARDELQRHYQQRIRDRQTDIEQYKIAKDLETENERANLANVKRNLQRQLREVEEDLDIQRQELSTGFDEVLRRRENEFRTQLDDMCATALAHEMKVKLLSKELELVRTVNERASTQLGDADSNVRDLQKQLKEKEWELHDQAGIKDARIAELESQMELLEQSVKRAMEDFNRKHADLDRYAREKESTVLKIKDSHSEAERGYQDKIRELTSKLETTEVERRREEWSNQDAVKEKDVTIEKLQHEIGDVRRHSDAQLAKVSQDMVTKDLTITTLRETQTKLKAELVQRTEDTERYKKELSLAIEREANLERSRTQAELDWQRRCEDLERVQYSKSEDLIERLTKSKDEALATVREKDRELSQREDYIRVLTADRDHAFATLRKNNLQINRDILPSKEHQDDQTGSASQQLQSLQEENRLLRDVIHGMREDMEQLGDNQQGANQQGANQQGANQRSDTKAAGDDGSSHPPITEGYVKILEKESRDLKLQVRDLEEKLETKRQEAVDDGAPLVGGAAGTKVDPMDNAYIRSHVQSLNDTVGALRSEKVTLSAQLKRHQARVAHLESSISQLQRQPYEKQVEVEQLQYELTTSVRRHASETAGLRLRVTELELQLAETRREADEYFKGGLQTNLEATALGNQVSALKMDLVSNQPLIGNSQPALVYQLKEEIHSLKMKLAARGGSEAEAVLKAKLKGAAHHISRLARERQQLIQLGNKLRSELARYTGPVQGPRATTMAKNDGRTTAGELATEISSKLNNLEKLQYALTKQELQYAQKGLERDQRTTEVIQVQLDSSSSSESPPETDQEPHRTLQPPTGVSSGPRNPSQTEPVESPHGSQDSLDTMSKDSIPLMMSSYGGESLQDVWQILDEGRSPTFMRSPTPQALKYYGTDKFLSVPSIPERPMGHAGNSLGVEGKVTHLQTKPGRGKQDRLSSKAAGRVQPKSSPQKPRQKIRNYNIQNDVNR